MKSIHTEIEIKAPVEKVWNILMDIEKYPEWNPFIKSIEGEIKVGVQFKVVIQPPDSKAMTFKPKCLVLNENNELKWLGHLLVPGLFDGEHKFKMKALDSGKTKLVQCENFSGILLPLLWKKLNTKTLQGFEMMNRALKERAEL